MEIEEATISLTSEPKTIRAWHLVGILILVVCAFMFHAWARATIDLVQIHVLDVGQGDAILIQIPNGNRVLIDGGPDGTVLSRLGRYIPSWDKSIDMVVASHKHSDHIAGLVAVLERYDVARIIQGFESYDSGQVRAWNEAVQAEGALVTEALRGTEVSLGASTSLTIIFPADSREGTYTRDANNDSVIFMFRHERVRMLFTGDAEQEVERLLVLEGVDLDADILKAGHHGSKTSTTESFLSVVTPQVVIMSVGEGNRYKHPSPVVLARLESFGIPYYRTDQKGDVTVTSDGRSFSIRTER